MDPANDHGQSSRTAETVEAAEGPKPPWRKGPALGRGSGGTVYKALDSNGMVFAVKEVLIMQDDKARQAAADLEKEMKILKAVKHENIVKYLGAEQTADTLNLFLEYVELGSLDKVYRERKLTELDIRLFSRDILRGLECLHDRKIVHRDIKCANILVDRTRTCKLADFGVAKQISTLTMGNTLVGTAQWMAPEVIKSNQDAYGLPADIWSLGCSVLEMAMGAPPFAGLALPQVIFRVGQGKAPEVPDTLSNSLQDFLKQCLEIKPTKRATASALLQHPFIRPLQEMRFPGRPTIISRLMNRFLPYPKITIFEAISQEFAIVGVQPTLFSYHDINLATSSFHSSKKLGFGAFGATYKGILRNGTPIAVKRLFNTEKWQLIEEFVNEVVLTTKINHENLVQLKGCCFEQQELILVHEYAENGNVYEALWGDDTKRKLDWVHRWNTCLGIARGLSYLHEELDSRIVHRDIKPSNILFDHNWNPKIADFGLAKLEKTYVSTIAGTRGYFAPEYVLEGQYVLEGHFTTKADVFSYGILVLEIISGRKCIDANLPDDQIDIKNWAEDLQNNGKLLDLLDTRLTTSISETDAMRIINIALVCVQNDPNRRPTMCQVVSMLLGNMEAPTYDEGTNNTSNVGEELANELVTFEGTDDSSNVGEGLPNEWVMFL